MSEAFRDYIATELNKMTDKEKLEYAQNMENGLYEFGYPYPVSKETRELIIADINRIRSLATKVKNDG